jgi:N-acetylmuramoyl-L-alanine amidase
MTMAVLLKKGSRGEMVKQLQKALNLIPDGIFGTVTEETVKAFQKTKGLAPDGIVGDKTWALLLNPSSDGGILKQSKRTIKEIIVHCSATREGRDYTVADITKWHKQRGFNDIGYHYVIYRDGSLHNGRDVNLVGAHCTNHNAHSIGVCYIGGCKFDGVTPKDTRTDAQKASLLKFLKDLKRMYPQATISGHRNWCNKACPCFDAKEEYKNI